jgi:hypothetical protein
MTTERHEISAATDELHISELADNANAHEVDKNTCRLALWRQPKKKNSARSKSQNEPNPHRPPIYDVSGSSSAPSSSDSVSLFERLRTSVDAPDSGKIGHGPYSGDCDSEMCNEFPYC